MNVRQRLLAGLVGGSLVIGISRRLPALNGVGLEWLLVPCALGLIVILAGPRELTVAARELWQKAPLLVALACADVAWTALSVAWSQQPRASLLEAARSLLTTCSAAVYYAVLRQPSPRECVLTLCNKLALLISGAALLGVALATAQITDAGAELGHRVAGAWPRATGFISTPGHFGASVLTFAGMTASIAAERGRAGCWTCWLCVAACCASLSAASLACGVLVIDVLLRGRVPRFTFAAVSLVSLAAIMLLYVHVHAVRLATARFERPAEPGYEPLGRTIHPLVEVDLGLLRAEWHETGYAAIHRAHLQRLASNAWGSGAGTFAAIPTGPILRSRGHWSERAAPHSWVLARASETGFVGLGIAIGLLIAAAHAAARALPGRSDRRSRLALGVVFATLALAVFYGDVVHQWPTAFFAALLASARGAGNVSGA